MNREDIIRMAIEARWDAHHAEFDTRIQAFAALVASAERERIKQANAPEIERINAYIKEALAQREQAPMNYYRADAKGNLERTDIHFAQPEQDGKCKYCTDGCAACDARKLPEQEPVAWRAKNFYENQEGWFYAEWHQDGLTPQVAELLYTTPSQRTWAGLTDEEIWESLGGIDCTRPMLIAQAIEAALKEKNK